MMKDNVNLESDFDHVLGQDASQEDVFDLARGNSAAASVEPQAVARHSPCWGIMSKVGSYNLPGYVSHRLGAQTIYMAQTSAAMRLIWHLRPMAFVSQRVLP